MKILVVDDEKDIRLLFQQHFKNEIKNEKITFYFALSGEEALNLLETVLHAQLILILSDINMPGMNGLELLRIIKSHHPNTTVYMITAYGDPTNCKMAWEYGAKEIFTKPINFTHLKTLILDFIRIHESQGNG